MYSHGDIYCFIFVHKGLYDKYTLIYLKDLDVFRIHLSFDLTTNRKTVKHIYTYLTLI